MTSALGTSSAPAGTGGKKPNVMILATSLWIGGAETVIRQLAQTIDRRRFNVVVCHLKHRGHIGDEIVKEGSEVIGIGTPQPGNVDYFTFTKLLRILHERQIDVVHTHTTHGLVDAALCKLFKPGLKIVNTFHFGNYPHTRPRLLWLEVIFSRLADRLVAVGGVQRRQIAKVFRFPDGRLETVRNGIVFSTAHDRQSFRERIGTGDRLLIGTIATLIKQKGLFDLLDVARRIVDAGHRVQFVVVGEGHLRPALEARRAELGLDDTVVFPGWVTSAADVALPAFDIFFQPSLWEAMSVVILEAMACEKPIVATRVGETPEILEHGVDGLMVDAGDVDGMAAALNQVIADRALAGRLAAAAKEKVQHGYSVQDMTSRYERIYAELFG